MLIPDFQTLTRPLLQHLLDGQPHRFADFLPLVAQDFGLSEEQLAQLLPSGRQTTFRNRLHWASFYLLKAGVVSRPKRDWLELTARGRELLAKNGAINSKVLQQYEGIPGIHGRRSRGRECYPFYQRTHRCPDAIGAT
jgi:restriction system protein